jgi:uncharacterized membrane protein HdeD (DUF308 family)
VTGARIALLVLLLAVGVAIVDRGLVRLVEASGARDQPAVILVLLLSAFLGLLSAVLARAMRLPGAAAPTALVLGWIAVPVLFAAIPGQATQLFAGDARLQPTESVALLVAVVAAAVTLAVSGRSD